MKRLKLTKVIASTLVVASVIALNPIGASAEWRQASRGWWYAESNSWATGWRTIDGKWYYFDGNGYMLHDTTVDSYKLGSDGAWVSTSPTASTATTSSTTSTTTTSSTTSNKDIGFDEMELSSKTATNLRQYYNKSYNVIDNINELSVGGKDYLNTYEKGNILGTKFQKGYSDYVFDLNGNYSAFSAMVGIDDHLSHRQVTFYYDVPTNVVEKIKNKEIGIKVLIIADGTVLDTKDIYYGDELVKIDVNNLENYNELRIRVQCNTHNENINYDILGGKFHHK